jgi:prepilin-type N-terminal cleavage/methylation domain-containing protein
MRKSTSGFTIVELIITIVVIGILAGITIVAYSGIRVRAQNDERVAELKAWEKSFVQYKAANNGQYPEMSEGGYCLGTNFPNQKCRDYRVSGESAYLEANSTALMTALRTYDPPASGLHSPVNGTVGPYALYTGTTIELTAVLEGNSSVCPSGTYFAWGDASGIRALCRVVLTR